MRELQKGESNILKCTFVKKNHPETHKQHRQSKNGKTDREFSCGLLEAALSQNV